MDFQEDSKLASNLLHAFYGDIQEYRPDIHMSDLIYCLTKSFYKKQSDALPPTDKTLGYFIIGLGLEKALLAPHEMQIRGDIDGVKLSTDALIQMPFHEGYLELKTTRIAPGNFPFKAGQLNLPEGWMRQLLGEMKLIGTNTITLAMLHIIASELKCWRITATQEEIDLNWQWIQIRKEVLSEALELDIAPKQFTWNLGSWECDGCEYHLICAARQMGDLKGKII